jgi:hypothetical protein
MVESNSLTTEGTGEFLLVVHGSDGAGRRLLEWNRGLLRVGCILTIVTSFYGNDQGD